MLDMKTPGSWKLLLGARHLDELKFELYIYIIICMYIYIYVYYIIYIYILYYIILYIYIILYYIYNMGNMFTFQ